jgi:hypothetical protein
MDREDEKDLSKDFPRPWVPKEELLKRLRGLPPDPSLLDEIRELDGALDDLEDPWER